MDKAPRCTGAYLTFGRNVRWLKKVLPALVISALAFWFTLRKVSLKGFLEILSAADSYKLGPYIALFVLIQLVRAWRWQLLLSPVAKPGFQRVNAANAVGLLAVTLLPFRTGEIARPLMVTDPRDLTIIRAIPSILVERVLDLAFTAVILMVALLALPDLAGAKAVAKASGIAAIVISVILVGALLLLHGFRTRVAGWIGTAARQFHSEWGVRAERWILTLADAIRLPARSDHKALILFLSALYWAMAIASLQLVGGAIGLSLTFAMACATTGAITLGAVVPAGPGMAGVLQFGAFLALTQFLPQESLRPHIVAFAHLLWASQLILQVA